MRRTLTVTAKKICAAAQGWRCATCKELLPASFQVDHKLALADGGTDDPANLQALCGTCHAEKTLRENLVRADRKRDSAVTEAQFDALFERHGQSAYPLALANRLCLARYGATLDLAALGLWTARMEVFPPCWASLFLEMRMVPQPGGDVLQGVRRRGRGSIEIRGSTRSTRV